MSGSLILTPVDGAAGDRFGGSASLSADGRTAIVGGAYDDVGANIDQGSARVFVWNGSAWVQRGGALTPTDGQAGDLFGFSVALSADGLIAIVGGMNDAVTSPFSSPAFGNTINFGQGSARVFVWDGASWQQRGAALTPIDGASYDGFGFSVDLSANGLIAIVGARADDVNDIDQGSARVFVWDGAAWQQRGRALTPIDGLAGDSFGSNVALSADGLTAIVGGPQDDVGGNIDQGTARVFTWSGSAWVQRGAALTAADGAAADYFGSGVALSADGLTAIVGGGGDDVDGKADQGSARVFTWNGIAWVQRGNALTPTDGSAGDRFGNRVDLSADGLTAIISGGADDIGVNVDQGSARVFTWNGSAWVQRGSALTPADGAASDYFGSFALSADGLRAIVSSSFDDIATNIDQGSARIFEWSGSAWVEGAPVPFVSVSSISASKPEGNSAGPTPYTFAVTRYGYNNIVQSVNWSVVNSEADSAGADDFYIGQTLTGSILFDVGESTKNITIYVSADDLVERDEFFNIVLSGASGGLIIGSGSAVGTIINDEPPLLTPVDGAANAFSGGSVDLSSDGMTAILGGDLARVFVWDGGGWQQRGVALTPTGGAPGVATEVAISADGLTAIVGNRYEDVGDNVDQGSARVFTWSGSAWVQRGGAITPLDGAAGDGFGTDVALSADGLTAIIGGGGDDIAVSIDQGSARVFTWNGSAWIQRGAAITPVDGAAGDVFGWSVDISDDGSTAIVGGYVDNVGANVDQGSARVFTWSGSTWVQRGAALTPVDGTAHDLFGEAVALSADGLTAIVGAPSADVGRNIGQGRAHVFTWDGSAWMSRGGDLIPADSGSVKGFGGAVALSADGRTAIVGSQSAVVGSNLSQGSAHAFFWNGTSWIQLGGTITLADGAPYDFFANSISLSADGRTAIIGHPKDDVGANIDQGSARVFAWSGSAWVEGAPATPTDLLSLSAIAASKAEGNSGATSYTFTATRTGDTSTVQTAAWAVTGSGTNAAAATDFLGNALPTGTVSFGIGETSKTITIEVAGDASVESDEGFTVTLSSPSTGLVLGTASATGSIINDDASVSLAATSATKAEGQSGTTSYTFTATRSGDTSVTHTAAWSVTGSGTNPAVAADFVGNALPSGTVTFGIGETSKVITIDVLGDASVENIEGFTVTLSSPSAGLVIGTSSAIGSIINDDASVSLAATSASKAEGQSGTTSYTFTATRSGDTSVTHTAAWSVTGSGTNAAAAADFVGNALPSGTVTFGIGETSKVITIDVLGDTSVESTEGFTVALSSPSAGLVIGTPSATGSIINDDLSNVPSEGDDILTGTQNADTLTGLSGNDTLIGVGGNDVIDGGAGVDLASFSGSLSDYRFGLDGNTLIVSGPDGIDRLSNVEALSFGGAAPVLVSALQGLEPLVTVQTGGVSTKVLPDRYVGPVDWLEYQTLGSPNGDVVIGTSRNDFFNLLGGDDAANGGAGDDVLDGGTGSNFLTGGAGRDDFFLDGRGGTTTWATITDWEVGERLSVFGWRPGVSQVQWIDSAGAPGWEGVTMHGDLDGNGVIDTSVTWTGRTRDQLPTPMQFDGLLWFT